MSGNCESVLALGAQSSAIQKLILVRGVRLALLGIVFGVAGSVALAKSASSMLYGVPPAQLIELVWRFVVAGLCGFARMLCTGPQSHSRRSLGGAAPGMNHRKASGTFEAQNQRFSAEVCCADRDVKYLVKTAASNRNTPSGKI